MSLGKLNYCCNAWRLDIAVALLNTISPVLHFSAFCDLNCRNCFWRNGNAWCLK